MTLPPKLEKIKIIEKQRAAQFCSMKITQDVRDYAEQLGVDEKEALDQGMAEMSQTFKDKGAEIYQKI